jgi:pSer/pThr/pTyr-binding forkhead associated (FHA) protein
MRFQDIFKNRRKELRLRQSDVAKKLGITSVTVGDYERGKSFPKMETLQDLCTLLDMDYEEMRILVIEERKEAEVEKAQTKAEFRKSASPIAIQEETKTPVQTGSSPVHYLEVLDTLQNNLIGNKYYLTKTETSIGREIENDIVILNDDYISRKHARLKKTGDGFEIEDLGSRNGTFVNDSRIQQQRVNLGDEIWLGPHTCLKLKVEKVPEPTPTKESTKQRRAEEPNGLS